LSEATFLLPPTDLDADYYVRIFTPGGELPFAGHPTLGSCHAWLAAGGKPRNSSLVAQQCGVGLVRVRCNGPRLEFVAPPLRRARARRAGENRQGAHPAAIGHRSPPVGGQWPGLVRGDAPLREPGTFAQTGLGLARSA